MEKEQEKPLPMPYVPLSIEEKEERYRTKPCRHGDRCRNKANCLFIHKEHTLWCRQDQIAHKGKWVYLLADGTVDTLHRNENKIWQAGRDGCGYRLAEGNAKCPFKHRCRQGKVCDDKDCKLEHPKIETEKENDEKKGILNLRLCPHGDIFGKCGHYKSWCNENWYVHRQLQCKYWNNFGWCHLGNHCLYLHLSKLPQKQCVHWAKGKCNNGNRCRKMHATNNPRLAIPQEARVFYEEQGLIPI